MNTKDDANKNIEDLALLWFRDCPMSVQCKIIKVMTVPNSKPWMGYQFKLDYPIFGSDTINLRQIFNVVETEGSKKQRYIFCPANKANMLTAAEMLMEASVREDDAIRERLDNLSNERATLQDYISKLKASLKE